MNWETVIGLEVHVELNTKTKMFCRCSADYFGKKPNTNTCPVCLGLPGALPYTNAEAIRKCIRIGLALKCDISSESLFERKNYFYPDLAKGYQISQYRWPLCKNGEIEIKDKDGQTKKIRINRVHQEEDTGKLTHNDRLTLIDFNRSGVPLVEIVTEPDFRDTFEIKDYGKKLQNIFQTLGVSAADMEKGDMRLEANISVRLVGQKDLPDYRVELKNINSFRFMAAAVEYEIKRQIEVLEKNEILHQETRGWNETKKVTFVQRSKEEANDYRYFPEPDIPVLIQDKVEVEKIKSELPELPNQREQRYIDFGMSTVSAATIAGLYKKSQVFESTLAKFGVTDKGAFGDFFANQPSDDTQKIYQKFQDKKKAKSEQISDESELELIAKEIINKNENIVGDFEAGNQNAIQALIGALMVKTQGKADPQKAKKILEELLKAS